MYSIKVYNSHKDSVLESQIVEIGENTTVDDVLRLSLTKFSIPDGELKNYELRDVIGRCDENGWVEECGKILYSNEKLFSIDQFIKPLSGFIRRFELRENKCAYKRKGYFSNFFVSYYE